MERNCVAEHRVVEHRVVDGELLSRVHAADRAVEIEVLRRRADRPIHWRFRQSRPALFWYGAGVERMTIVAGEAHTTLSPATDGSLALFPAGLAVEGLFELSREADYAVVFLDDPFLRSLPITDDYPVLGFGDAALVAAMRRLMVEARQPTVPYFLFLRAWAMQAIAIAALRKVSPARGGLAPYQLARVEAHVRERLGERLRIAELAEVAGCSVRHFQRAFRQTTGRTPHAYLHALRIAQAEKLLAGNHGSLTDVAHRCGFAHAQHFATAFRLATGIAPSRYRRERA